MEPVKVFEIFDQDELKLLDSIIVEIKDFEIHDDLGRSFHHLEHFPKNLEDKLTNYVKEQTGKNVKLTGRAFSTYSNQYGIPALPPHLDMNDTSFILDYQYKANTQWSIMVEKNEYFLEDNNGLLLAGKTKVHWRPKKQFLDDEFVSMIFFHFLDIDANKTSNEFTDDEMRAHNKKIKEEYSFYWNN